VIQIVRVLVKRATLAHGPVLIDRRMYENREISRIFMLNEQPLRYFPAAPGGL
jgi:hypothetical protein